MFRYTKWIQMLQGCTTERPEPVIRFSAICYATTIQLLHVYVTADQWSQESISPFRPTLALCEKTHNTFIDLNEATQSSLAKKTQDHNFCCNATTAATNNYFLFLLGVFYFLNSWMNRLVYEICFCLKNYSIN